MDEALAVDGAAPPTPDAPAASSAPAYPRHWEADVVAWDGGVVHLRPILPSDADAIVDFHSRLSERTRYMRYFGAHPHIPPRELEQLTVVDHHARVALVVLLGAEVIAVGCYEGTSARTARASSARRRSRSSSATITRAAGWVRSCSSTSPRPPGSVACAASRPRSWGRTPR